MRSLSFVVMLLGLLLPAVSSAQVPVRVKPGVEPGRGRGAGGGATPVDRNGVLAIEPLEAARPVKGAPYVADAITETTQVLADGNRIERRTTATVARDSDGRIRRERSALVLGALVVGNDVPLVTITDPANRTHLTLDSEQRIAFRMKMPVFKDGSRDATAPGGAQSFRPSRGWRDEPDVKSEQLGRRTIDGLIAEGTRTTMTIPAKAIGNQSPIVTVSERWFSPDLQVVILTRRSDPRFGDTEYRLINIKRIEPLPDLFRVPAGYRIEEQTLPPPPQRP